jgi:two-component system, OmpR family, response regulator
VLTPAAQVSVRPLSVLVVEDHQDVAQTLAQYLELCCGFRVTVAADGESGVRDGLADPPDAVVADIGLPGKDGFQLARELTGTLWPRPLLIAVTAYAGDDMRERGKAAGFDHYLVKPVDPREVEELLRAHERRLAAAPDRPPPTRLTGPRA